MRFVLLALVMSCGGAEVQPSAPMSQGLHCGSATCADSELCIRTMVGPGTPPPDGASHTTVSESCAAQPLANGNAWSCTAVKDRRESCQAMIPAAPPH